VAGNEAAGIKISSKKWSGGIVEVVSGNEASVVEVAATVTLTGTHNKKSSPAVGTEPGAEVATAALATV
jgi:hypothetical protein